MAVPVRRGFVEMSVQELNTREGRVARFVAGGLEGIEKGDEAESTPGEREEKGAPVMVRWSSMGPVRVYLDVEHK
jgi:hypothetical protein